jgi:hypothetical protein
MRERTRLQQPRSQLSLQEQIADMQRRNAALVPTVNPKRLSITGESVDNHLRWVISSS